MLAPTAAPAPVWDDDAGLRGLRRPRDRSPRERRTTFSCRLVPGGHPGGRRSRGLAKRFSMKIRAGYEISYDCPQPTPMILALSVHPSRVPDLLTPDCMRLDPPLHADRKSTRLNSSHPSISYAVF